MKSLETAKTCSFRACFEPIVDGYDIFNPPETVAEAADFSRDIT